MTTTSPEPDGNGEGTFYVINGPDPEAPPTALVADRGRGLYERWSGEEFGWVDTPYYARYFMGGMSGAEQVDPEDVEDWKESVRIPSANAVETMRGAP